MYINIYIRIYTYVLSFSDVTILVIQHPRYTMALRAYTAYRQTDTRGRIFRKTTRWAEKYQNNQVNKLLLCSCLAPACTAQSKGIHTRLPSKIASLSYLRPFRNTHKGNCIKVLWNSPPWSNIKPKYYFRNPKQEGMEDA